MKDSKEYSKKVRQLYLSLKSKNPEVERVSYDEPADALVYATISENINESAAEAAIKRFADYFVDLNDLRVSREEEIVELLGEDTPVTRDAASRLGAALRAIFNQYHKISLEALKKIGKRPAKQALQKIEGTSRFVVNYCMLTSLRGHAIPLTQKMIEYLRNNELVHPGADKQEIEGFLAKRTSAADAYEFYALLRSESELPPEKQKGIITRKTKSKAGTKA